MLAQAASGVDAERAAVSADRRPTKPLGRRPRAGSCGRSSARAECRSAPADGRVEAAPPDIGVRVGLVDQVLVPGRAAGVPAGANDERAVGGEDALVAPDRVLVQLGHGQVGVTRAAQRAACRLVCNPRLAGLSMVVATRPALLAEQKRGRTQPALDLADRRACPGLGSKASGGSRLSQFVGRGLYAARPPRRPASIRNRWDTPRVTCP